MDASTEHTVQDKIFWTVPRVSRVAQQVRPNLSDSSNSKIPPNPARMTRPSHGRSCPKRGTRRLGPLIFHRETLSKSPYDDLIPSLENLFTLSRDCQAFSPGWPAAANPQLPSWPIRAAKDKRIGGRVYSVLRTGHVAPPTRHPGSAQHSSIKTPPHAQARRDMAPYHCPSPPRPCFLVPRLHDDAIGTLNRLHCVRQPDSLALKDGEAADADLRLSGGKKKSPHV